MAINQLTTANTFQHWLQATQSLIGVANTLTDGNGSTFIANTILDISGDGSQLNVRNSGAVNTLYANTANIANVSFSGSNISVPGNVEISGNLIVSGNITLDAMGFDDLIVAGGATIGTTLDVTGNTTLTNATINYVNLPNANIINLASSSGLLNVNSNVFVSDWVFSSNANVRSGVTTFAVTNSGSSAYLFDQYSGNNPDIYLHPGQTVSFNINATGHPFLIRQSAGGTLYNVGLTHVSTTGVVTTEADAQAKVTGTLIWKVPSSLVGTTYVYQCQNHAGMVGNLIIQNTVTAAFAAANNAGSDGLAFAIALG
jgi:plastocyanin